MHAILSLLYLAFPVAVFFDAWLWWPYALAIEGVMVLSLGHAVAVLWRGD